MMNDEQSAPDPDSSSQDSASEEPTSEATSDEQQLPPGAAAGTLGEDRVREELKKVIDPELFVNIVDLGLIYEVAISDADDGQKNIAIEMTLTSPMCPAGPQLIGQSKQVLTQLENVADVEVKVVMDPPWTPEKMTDDARDQLGIF
ncbi:MAG: metal-sulfur cluster assembly factor [Pirellulaceae bacterium]|jgi:metal-sulfur cluster biosynthetic enzyme